PAASVFFDSPVAAWTDALIAPFGISLPAPRHEDGRYLNLRIDLDHPADTLLPLIERELGRYSRQYRRQRRRLKEAPFNLRVFDLAESGETFKAIFQTVRKPVTTVRSAYLTASRNVFGPGLTHSKKTLPLVNFDANAHCETCPTCRKATLPNHHDLRRTF